MSTKDLMRIVGDQIEENLSSYSDEELIDEVGEYYPELLEDWIMHKSTLDLFSNHEDERNEIDDAFDSALEERAAELEITVDYYIAEFLWSWKSSPIPLPLILSTLTLTCVIFNQDCKMKIQHL